MSWRCGQSGVGAEVRSSLSGRMLIRALLVLNGRGSGRKRLAYNMVKSWWRTYGLVRMGWFLGVLR